MKSFRTELFSKIKLSDMQYDDGSFYKYATDVVFYQPLLEISCGRILWVRDEMQYIYTWNTGLNEPREKQLAVAQAVWSKPKSACDEDFRKRMEAP